MEIAAVSVTSVAAVIGATTAVAAAIFSGLTLYLAGRRETRKWLRESTLDAHVQFLDASFAYPGRRLYEYLGEFPAGMQVDLSKHSADYLKAHAAQNEALTKIRLQSGGEVVRAAEELHEADERVSLKLVANETFPSPEEYEAMSATRRVAREAFIEAARQFMELPAGVSISHSLEPRRDPEDSHQDV